MVYDVLFATDANFKIQTTRWSTVEDQRRQADLHVHVARRPQIPRRRAGARGRLRRLDRTLGEARQLRPEARRDRPTHDRGQRQDVPPQANRSRCSTRSANLRRTCRSSCRSVSPRPMPSRRSRIRSARDRSSSSRTSGCRATRSVCVKNTDYVPRKEPPFVRCRRQGRQGRSGRVALHPRCRHRRGGTQRRRSRLVGAAAAGPDPGAGAQQGRQGRRHRSARQHRR